MKLSEIDKEIPKKFIMKSLLFAKRFHIFPQILKYFCSLLNMVPIGAKRGGTQEQCSQKLFELAEIFRKIIKGFKHY